MPLPTFPPIGGNAHVFTRSVTARNACQGNQSRLKAAVRTPTAKRAYARIRQAPPATPTPLGLHRTPYKPFSGVGVGNPTHPRPQRGLEGRITNHRRRRVSRRSVTGCNACRGNMQKNLVGGVSASPEKHKSRLKRGVREIENMTKVAEN